MRINKIPELRGINKKLIGLTAEKTNDEALGRVKSRF